MVRHACAWIVMLALVVGLAAPVLAQQAPVSSAPAKSEPAKTAPAQPAPAKTAAKAKSATGTVKSASADSVVLVVAGKDPAKDKKEMTFSVDKDTKITKGGKAAMAADIAANDAATVTYTEADGKMTAKSVSVKIKTAAAAKPKS